ARFSGNGAERGDRGGSLPGAGGAAARDRTGGGTRLGPHAPADAGAARAPLRSAGGPAAARRPPPPQPVGDARLELPVVVAGSAAILRTSVRISWGVDR